MVIKINYTSSDVYVSTSVSPVYVVVNYSGTTTGAAIWGQITGTLSDQTDLQTALDDKVPYTGATANVDLGGFSIKPSMVQITGINSGGTGGVLNLKKGNTRVIGGDDAANNISLWAETGAFGFNDWTAGNTRDAKFSLLSITNNATRTYTLPNLDGTLALLSDITPGLTSVGLSMPSAFAVSNSPLTSNGTIAVTGAGTASQYVRGDGQLATLPSGAGGGSSVNYYLNGSVNQGTIGGSVYYEMNRIPVIGTGTDFTRTNLQGDGLIAQFITDANDPNRLEIPAGAWNFEMYFNVSSAGGSPAFYLELLKYDGTTFTSIANGSTNPETITGGTAVDLYLSSLAVPQTTLLATDRLAIRVYVITSGRNITLHTEDNNLCEIITTFAGGVASLNGLTANTQYFATGTSGTDFAISSVTDTHTFNLPTASATNRGALSSADWSTFSAKVGGSGTAGQVAYWNGTNSQTGSNNLFWDAANSRLGVGTNTPARALDVRGAARIETASTTELDLIAGGGNIVRLASSATTPFIGTLTSAPFGFITAAVERARVSTNGNLLVGTTSDGGQRLQVQGDAFIKGSGNTNSTLVLTAQNSDSANVLRIFNGGSIGIGNSSDRPLIFPFTTSSGSAAILGTNLSFFNYTSTQSSIQGNFSFENTASAQTSGANSFLRLSNTFAPTSGTATQALLFITNTINQTGGANGITRGLYVNPTLTAAADWRSIEWSNNSGWGLYGAGTANNYLGGNLVIGTTSVSTFALDVNGTARVSGVLTANGGGVFGSDVTVTGSSSNSIGAGSLYQLVGSTSSVSSVIQLNASGGIDIWSLVSSSWQKNVVIANTGAATFSSSVTATSLVKSGGTSSQYLMADGSVTTGSSLTITNRQTASYTLVLADADKLVEMNVATANNLTVPLNSSVAFAIGTKIDLAQYGAGQTTVVATGGVTVRSAGGALKLAVQYSGASLVKIGTDEWYLFGDITV